MLEPELIHSINSGKCFVLIGAGPSCEMGYPDWRTLATRVVEAVAEEHPDFPIADCRAMLTKKDYTAAFRVVERYLGDDRKALVAMVEPHLRSRPGKPGHIYELLARWPFRVYLTTIYDDEIDLHLRRHGADYRTLYNSVSDLAQLREGVTNKIVKLHGDFVHLPELVITSRDYQRLQTGGLSAAFRDRLKAVLNTFDIMVVGYSLSDPHVSDLLQIVKDSSSIENPIHLIAADVSKEEQVELRERFNIRTTTYRNNDGTHAELRHLLSAADPFVASRGEVRSIELVSVDPEEVEAVASLAAYRRLQSFRDLEKVEAVSFLGPLVLRLFEQAPEHARSLEQLCSHPMLAGATKGDEGLSQCLRETLLQLKDLKYLESEGKAFRLTTTGRERVLESVQDRQFVRDRAIQRFADRMAELSHPLTVAEHKRASAAIEGALVSAFKSRGMCIAKGILVGRPPLPSDLTSVFKAIRTASQSFDNVEERAAFMKAAYEYIHTPTDVQKRHLSGLVQGYFLYHLIGQDPSCQRIRKQLAEQVAWIVDSSVLIRYFALGHKDHRYHRGLIDALRKSGAKLLTTELLVDELETHLIWALDHTKKHSEDSPEFISAALGKEPYTENVFLQGYVAHSAVGETGSFVNYLARIFPRGVTSDAVRGALEQLGFHIVDAKKEFDRGAGSKDTLKAIRSELTAERQRRDNYRSEQQVEAESLVLLLIKKIREKEFDVGIASSQRPRAYFFSTSRIVDRIEHDGETITWLPDAVQRYVTLLPGDEVAEEDIYQSVVSESYFAGVEFVRGSQFKRFFGGVIDDARASFEEEQKRYVRFVEGIATDKLKKAFDATPDVEKATFVRQMAFAAARAAVKQNVDLMAELAQLKRASKEKLLLSESEIDERVNRKVQERVGRHKNAADPKHQRKRARQKKKRLYKKKRGK